ncbi:MAG TPA: glycosyltransferase family 39 protein [Bryobacteraceae bacterium]|nr:glycosyltransferase family 39 protein [Bryobacteraceae bacterium]
MSKSCIGPAASLHRVLRSRVLKFVAVTAILVCALVPIVAGLGKSLWRDEAWVANSVRSATLRNVFYYDDWLQTSPPLFLVVARWTVQALGTENWAFRVVPFLAYLSGALLWWILVRRLLSRWQAVFAWTLFVLNATAVLYAGQMKPYCSDLACSTAVLLILVLYLERPTILRFSMLAALACAGPLLSYPLILLMPGIMVAMWIRDGWRRTTIVALASAALFTLEWRVLIAPNSSSDLRAFWTLGIRDQGVLRAGFSAVVRLFDTVRLPVPAALMKRQWLLMTAVGVWIALGLWAYTRRFRGTAPKWAPALAACAISWVVAIAADLLALYPISLRTSLFLLPALLLILTSTFELLQPVAAARLGRSRVVPWWSLAMIAMTGAIATVFVRAQWSAPLGRPEEDMQSAVLFLKPAVERGDALWVHATASETFKLYSGMAAWKPTGLIARGNTGWPCCPRPAPGRTGGGGVAVSADMEAKLPMRLPARLWFLYSSKLVEPTGELQETRAYLSLRGCTESQAESFTGVGILAFRCEAGDRVP